MATFCSANLAALHVTIQGHRRAGFSAAKPLVWVRLAARHAGILAEFSR